ncbi:CLUMA_CG005884, isoform A [Clunio marinus]|uniref:CLUMA_CG005884, isoform A n=1 Tax=Clunio marinus TaxID=568069 RepID=A0A1J1HXQ4_9DIPT|nr:CLUMA_CG005884, isoform A [Clunio marinus]
MNIFPGLSHANSRHHTKDLFPNDFVYISKFVSQRRRNFLVRNLKTVRKGTTRSHVDLKESKKRETSGSCHPR